MPRFGKTSTKRLDTCHVDLQRLFNRVVEKFDCSVVQGYRGQEEQDRYFDTGKSKVKFPNGKHNGKPSEAADVAPFINGDISWNQKHCLYFAGYVLGVASEMKIKIRWGGDWDMDNEAMTDQKFQDLVHFELV